MGGYERNAAPFTAGPASLDAVPADFNAKLLPGDWERFVQIAENAAIRVPAMADLGVRRLINGPEAFTPDNEFCLGQTEVDGLFVAAGFCAHGIAGAGGVGRLMAEWIVDGEPSMDVAHMDINRFGAAVPIAVVHPRSAPWRTTRPTTTSGFRATSGRRAGRCADRRSSAGTRPPVPSSGRRAAGSGSITTAATRPPGTLDAPGRLGREQLLPAVAAEHRATRERVGAVRRIVLRQDPGGRAGRGPFLQWVCDNNVARAVGRVTYTQLLNSRGGIEADVTVTRVGPRVLAGHRDGLRLPRRRGCGARPGPAGMTSISPTSPVSTRVSRCGARGPGSCCRL